MKHLWVIVFSHDCHCVMVSFFSGPLPDVWCTGRCCLDLEWVQTHACHWVQTQGCTHMYIAHTHTHIHTHTHTHTGNNMTVVYLEEVPLQSLNTFKGRYIHAVHNCNIMYQDCLHFDLQKLLAITLKALSFGILSMVKIILDQGMLPRLLNTVWTNHLHIAFIQ